ncbi:MAG TPA: NAD(P)H-binding protein, partial [Ignavibacteriaceae bacterium]|nr:NAD(P)H-binding protein [Ignavibacteriaceae bacterium]
MFSAKGNDEKKTLVIGGAGKTGSRVIKRLNKKNIPVRTGSRSSNPKFDWLDETTWMPALHNIKSVYITVYPDLAVPGSADKIQTLVNYSKESGISKLVLLSGRGEEEAQKCEQIIIDSGIDWTILRASWFNQNFSENYLLEPILAGYVALPAGKVGEPFIDADDIADAAAAALTEEGHSNKLYEITGPRLLTFEEAISEISKATGRQIIFKHLTIEEYAQMLKEYNVPDDFIELITYLFREVLDGRNESVTNGIQQALGHKPKDFSDFAKETADSGVWSVAENT